MKESTEARLAHLEQVCALQTQLIDKLGLVMTAHQGQIEALAALAGVEPQRPAPRLPVSAN